MMALKLDVVRLAELTESRHGSAKSLEGHWIDRYGDAPHKTTFDNWLKSDVFRGSFENYIKLCACLEIDPAALVDTNIRRSPSFAEDILWKALSAVGGRGIIAADLVQLFGPRPDWPNNALVNKAFQRNWHRCYFRNGGNSGGYYQSVCINILERQRPVVFHFAFRMPTSKLWRIYGYVLVDKEQAILTHFFGSDGLEKLEQKKSVTLQTHFGNGPTEFCVASLHNFDLELVKNSEAILPLCFNI